MDLRNGLKWAGFGAIGGGTVFAIMLILFGNEFTEFQAKCLGTTFLVGYFGVLAFAGVPRGNERWNILGYIAYVSAAIGILCGLKLIWGDSGHFFSAQDTIDKLFWSTFVLSFGNAWASMVSRFLDGHKAVRRIAIAAATSVGLISLLFIALIWIKDQQLQRFVEEHWREILALTIFSVGSTLTLPIVRSLTKGKAVESTQVS